MSHVYVCYSRPNKSYADSLANDLRRRGFEVWIDDRTDLDKQHLLKIVKAIQECDAFILLYSAIAEESNLVQRETDFALKNEKPFFTLMLEGQTEGADSYDVSDGSLPPLEFYDKLKQYTPVKIDPTTTDDLFEDDEDLFGDLDLDSIEPIVRNDDKLSIDDVDMNSLLSESSSSDGKKGGKKGKRGRSRVLLGGVGLIILLLLLVVVAVILSQGDDEPKVAQNTEVPTATETDIPTEVPTETLEPTATVTLEPSATETSTLTPTSTIINTPAPSLTPLPFWLQPVLDNEDWEPYVKDFDGVSMVLVPPGCFTMGSTQAEVDLAIEACNDNCSTKERLGDDAFLDEMPAHEICFAEPFWIDQYEVSNGQYVSNDTVARANRPKDGLTGVEALAYCESREMRLPTESEWEYGAKGPSNWLYPWGMEYYNKLAVSQDGLFASPKTVGSRQITSWIGAYDMSGNVWEWTSTIYLPYPYVNDEEHENPEDLESFRVLRGGSLSDRQPEMRTTIRLAYSTVEEIPNFHWYGVRCARDFSEEDLAE